jgi:hypothetical protein
MKIRVYNLLIVLGVMLLLPACTNKQTSFEAESTAAKSLVETYCKADLNGANLSTDNFLKSGLSSFLVSGEFESPGWDTVSLIIKYTITYSKVNGKEAIITVSYDTLGEIPGAEEVTIDKRIENYNFKLVKIDGKWRLKTPYDLKPHISIDTAIRHIQVLYKTEKEAQPNAPKVIQRLKQLKEQL